ncbi:MAG: hypothetical protein ACFFDF_03600, partial [Candidatus Odinarchaeota archaeon]
MAHSLDPNTNYYGQDLSTYKVSNPLTYNLRSTSEIILKGTKILGTLDDTRYDDISYRVYGANQYGSNYEILVKTVDFDDAKSWELEYIIFADKNIDSIKLYSNKGTIEETINGNTLSGTTCIEDLKELYISTSDNLDHELSVDLLIYTTVNEEYETFIQTQSYNYNDYGVTSRADVQDHGWVEFKATGIFIKPLDGKVYYTSDAEAFAEGKAKTDGFYFYVDSDHNGFYETVYILSDTYLRLDSSGFMQFNVMAIGLNYDGMHDFAPYERLDQTESRVSNLDNLALESSKFGTDWVYNFNNLRKCELLWEEKSPLETLGLKPKDQIFEIYKLVESSEQNSKFSKLFYDIRHATYSNAWGLYRQQLVGDIIEQVFMSVTAGILSAYVETTISASSWGILASLGKFLGALTYFLTYTLMTKISIDIKLLQAKAKDDSLTFYAISRQNYRPTSLNNKAIDDRWLQDSMAAALIGHPGGYYATISGGEPGNQYTAQALVSPPNKARINNMFAGFSDLLWENFWSMGESDPDSFIALDFDDLNLNYFLHTSELPSYNQREFYSYINTKKGGNIYNIYDIYKSTTLGYLESVIKEKSDYQFTTIRPTCIDGRPLYEFVNEVQYERVLPQQVLYRPIVLSEHRYSQLAAKAGHLVITTQCKNYGNTTGIDPYKMMPFEVQAGYKAKIPIMNNSFYYPIISISLDIVKETDSEIGYFAKDIIIEDSYYRLDSGNLYFKQSLESIISEKNSDFHTWIEELFDCKVYYEINVYFRVFIPDKTQQTHESALAQATFYTIMDYFNQYTYAEITANMISEIAYTETLTFWSTLISAPLVFLGSWTVKGTEGMIGEAGMRLVDAGKSTLQKQMHKMLIGQVIGIALAPLKEVLQEIIQDGFTEALIENAVDIWGGSDDLGNLLSSIATSARETFGALGRLALGIDSDTKINFLSIFSLLKARITGDTDLRTKIMNNLEQRQEANLQKQAEMGVWQRLARSGFLKGFLMLIPSLFFGSFNFMSITSFSNMVEGVGSLAPQLYSEYKATQQAREHTAAQIQLNTMFKDDPSMSIDNLWLKNMKVPTSLAGNTFNDLYRDIQEDSNPDTKTELDNAPIVNVARLFNPNPCIDALIQQLRLTSKFNEIRIQNFFRNLDLLSSFNLEEGNVQTIEYRDDINRMAAKTLDSTISLGNDEEGILSVFNRDLIEYIYNEIYSLKKTISTNSEIKRIPFPVDLLDKAVTMLSSAIYDGLPVLIQQEQNIAINPEVTLKIINKIDSGLKINQLERIITDIGIFIAGGYQLEGKVNSVPDFNENSFEKTEENQERKKVFTVLGKSMFDLIKPNTDILVREMDADYEYKVGEIVVAKNKNGLKFIHRIEKILLINNKQYIVTQGTNNQGFDNGFITAENIIGVADLSEEAFAEVQERIKQGRNKREIAYGMPTKGSILTNIKLLTNNELQSVQGRYLALI